MNRATLWLLLAVSICASACREQATDVFLDGLHQPQPEFSVQQFNPIPSDARSRWDAPWWDMNDDELADSIQAANGRAFIGFKEPEARGGVDHLGRTLVSNATVSAGKAELQAIGATIELELERTPAVLAQVPLAMVSILRQNPLIDYIEPDGSVRWHGQDTTWNVIRVQGPSSWTTSTGSGS